MQERIVSEAAQTRELGYVNVVRFIALCERLGSEAPIEDILEQFKDIAKRYNEPHRYYHTLDHVNQTVSAIYNYTGMADDANVCEIGALLHDVIYQTHVGSVGNEEASSEYALSMIDHLKLPDRLKTPVATVILATRHNESPIDSNSQLLVNADLLYLGAPEREFDLAEQEIRTEYGWASDEQFARGRLDFWNRFLDQRENIYSQGPFYEKFESLAHRNIERSYQRLLSGIVPAMLSG